MTGRSAVAARGVAASLVGAVFVVDLWRAVRYPVLHGDSAGLVIGARHVVDCVHHRVFTSCQTWAGGQRSADGTSTHVGPWPLLQYIPAVALRAVRVSRESTLRALIVLDALALWALLALVWHTLRRTVAAVWAPVLVFGLLASPLLWYGTAGFGEALAATVVVAAVAATVLRARPVLVGVLVALACTTKETSVFFVFGLVVLCVLAQSARRADDDKASSRRLLVAAVVGAVAGVAANSAFNVFRFGSLRNTVYLQSYERAPDLGVVTRAFGAQWVAPNGGIVWFWPVAVAIVALTAVAAMFTLRCGRPTWRGVAPLLVAVALVVDIAGLATWYSPFGWVAWGPRLLLTLVPAMLLVSCVFADDRATAWLRHFLTSIWLWPAAVVTVVLALPQATVLYNARVIGQFFGGRDPHCPVDAHVGTNAHAYYRCFDYVAWRKRPFLLQRGLEGWHATGGKVFALLYVAALVAMVLLARGRAHDATALERAKEPVLR